MPPGPSFCVAGIALAAVALGAGACRRSGKAPPAPAVVVVRDGATATVGDGASADSPEPAAPAGPRWATWPVPHPPSTGLANPASYELGSRDVVVDKLTGLMWQRGVDARSFTWTEARRYCARLELAGHTDWRLPSRIELVSIVDLTHSQPSIDQHVFPHTPSDWFWTSSVDADNPGGAAWYVYFYFGYPKTDPMATSYRARCVRAADPAGSTPPAPAPSYEVGKDLVRDRGTGLTWQRRAPAKDLSFDEARKTCAGLRLGRQTGWRVPSMGELLTLVDERRSSPTIDVEAFPDTPNKSFWTSSPFADTPAMAWHVYFEYGNALYGLVKGPYRVRCVR